jgi:hypothetical protein
MFSLSYRRGCEEERGAEQRWEHKLRDLQVAVVWINNIISVKAISILNVEDGFRDGLALIRLIEVLSGVDLKVSFFIEANSKPKNPIKQSLGICSTTCEFG